MRLEHLKLLRCPCKSGVHLSRCLKAGFRHHRVVRSEESVEREARTSSPSFRVTKNSFSCCVSTFWMRDLDNIQNPYAFVGVSYISQHSYRINTFFAPKRRGHIFTRATFVRFSTKVYSYFMCPKEGCILYVGASCIPVIAVFNHQLLTSFILAKTPLPL